MIPVVDLGAFVGGSAQDRRTIGTQVDLACRDVGFLTVVGHGVDDGIIDRLHRAASAFFDLPLAARLEVAMPAPGYPYGYNPLEAEALNRSIGGAGGADLKETFNVGPIDPPPRPLADMDDPDERAVYAPNLWPSALPALRPAHYPPVDGSTAGPARLRAGAHTDYGTLTVLWTDGAPGLQVYLPATGWTDVAATEGGLIVNLGDLMARWTNDRWRSTMHRVVPTGPGRRLSVPFFHNANWDATIDCIVTDGASARYPPTTAGRHLMEKFRSTVV